jgi:hypothetical protein
VQLPYTEVIVGTGDLIESENIVEFRLLYQGELVASSNTHRRAAEKHDIRKYFHPQLRRLWSVKPGLRQLAESIGSHWIAENDQTPVSMQHRFNEGIAATGRNWQRAGFDFVPLVTSKFALRCSIDVLLLRPEEKKYVFEQGDIDGQLKTLFDALRIPKESSEAGGNIPADDEKPFFCLLEDDRLISEVHVTADQLLLLPNMRETKASDAFVNIHVKINHTVGSPFDRWFD